MIEVRSGIERVLERLDAVRHLPRGGWIARCPAHQDRSPSLKIDEGDAGRILLYCYAGCGARAIVTALGLTLLDLMGDGPPPPPRSAADCLMAELLRREKWVSQDVRDMYQLADLARCVDNYVTNVRRGKRANWDHLALAAKLETEAMALAAEIGAPW